jgi:hypothetical protein
VVTYRQWHFINVLAAKTEIFITYNQIKIFDLPELQLATKHKLCKDILKRLDKSLNLIVI